jgi:NitT/TauT family transport system ATP-binding protein
MEGLNGADPVIEIKGLGLTYERDSSVTEILRNLDLNIVRGEFVAIVGPSGVGKSTLLRVLMGLAAPSSGEVTVHADQTCERAMALVFQDARLLPWRRVISNVSFGLEKTKLTKAERCQRALKVLRGVGLEDLAHRYPHQLSGGQRQRVALARALAVNPSIMLMDEPFSALDALTRQALQDELVRVWDVYKKTVLFVTHDIDEAVYLADRVVALGGKPGEVKASLSIDVSRPRERHDRALQAYAIRVKEELMAEAIAREDWVI